jgi:hypothetical protein
LIDAGILTYRETPAARCGRGFVRGLHSAGKDAFFELPYTAGAACDGGFARLLFSLLGLA